jgi:hypothetical protein
MLVRKAALLLLASASTLQHSFAGAFPAGVRGGRRHGHGGVLLTAATRSVYRHTMADI